MSSVTAERREAAEPRRRWPWLAGGGALLLAAAIAGSAVLWARPDAASAPPRPPGDTTAVVRGDLSEETLAQGALRYTGGTPVSGPAGTLTAHAAAGATVRPGEALFAVDNVPVVLMTGALPQWRAFELGMGSGPDVQQLEATLAALGAFWAEPDEVFDENTREGIRIWQRESGRAVTGSIDLGEVFFAPGELRVAAVELAPGAATAPGAKILTVTSLQQAVSVELKPAQRELAVLGAAVEVELAGGKRVPGTVTAVEPPRQPPSEDPAGKPGAAVIPVTVALANPEDGAGLDQATVRVAFRSETREDVLSVPVGALLSLGGAELGVEVVRTDGSTARVPVRAGLFAGGLVEISGDGIAEGTTVVVPAS